jgi:Amt family ammonium transporter
MGKAMRGMGLLLLPATAAAAPGEVSAGDTALVLMSAALVLLMTPGLAFFYGGLVRSKNAVHTMMMSFVCMAVVGVVWMLAGYSLAFAPSSGPLAPFLGGLGFLGLGGVTGEVMPALAPTVPHAAFMLFQCMFAVITPALISGAVVERARMKAFVLFTALWSLLVYAPVAHWVWAPGGWLRSMGALDFAGGTVVHLNAAAGAVIAALLIGRRRGLRQPSVIPHNVPFALLGTGLLWFGWLGFNGGSALAANGLAAMAFANTFFAAAAAAAAWALTELKLHGKMSGVGLASGAVAGLVAITPAAGFVTPLSAAALGAFAGVLCLGAVRLRPRLGLDDALDVFAIHGVAGCAGALLTGVLATKAVNPDGADGSLALLGVQAVGVMATLAFSGGMSWLLLKVVALVTPLRAEDEEEASGMDLADGGERAYTDMGSLVEEVIPPEAPAGAAVLVGRPSEG